MSNILYCRVKDCAGFGTDVKAGERGDDGWCLAIRPTGRLWVNNNCISKSIVLIIIFKLRAEVFNFELINDRY